MVAYRKTITYSLYLSLKTLYTKVINCYTYVFSSNFIFFPVCRQFDAHFQYGWIFFLLAEKKVFLRTNRSVYVIAYNLDDNDNVIKRYSERGGGREKKNEKKNAIFVRIEFNLNVFIGFFSRLFRLHEYIPVFLYDKLSFIYEKNVIERNDSNYHYR